MSIDNTTASYHSVIWATCENDGHIIIANSNEGELHEFVRNNSADAEFLSRRLCGISAVDRNRKFSVNHKCLADKGFYCFINDDPYDGTIYRLCAKPQNPVHIDNPDDETQRILGNQKISVNTEKTDYFKI